MSYTAYNSCTVFRPSFHLFWSFLFFFLLHGVLAIGQIDTVRLNVLDTALSILPIEDSIKLNLGDTSLVTPINKSAISSKVEYSATDSIGLDLEKQKVFMFRDAGIKYEKIDQKAAYIEIDFNTSTLTALPRVDSLGKSYGQPEFKEGDQSFKSKEMRYNFKSRKGLIKNVITHEGEGYLHGEIVKKMDNDVSNMRFGGYTTCDLEHPHFALKFSKAKVIPGNKIVTGPAYMTIEDVPLPLVLPFGLFPSKKGQSSGVLIPTYGESTERGFYLENGGYYFGINEYLELRLVGDIYSRGSWAVKPVLNYRKRYKYNGNFNFNYSINTEGVRETPQFIKNRDFRVNWTHTQDAKARPRSRFNAKVNFGSSTFNRYNPVSAADYLTNTFGSSISYSTSFGDRVSFSSALSHRQNTTKKTIDLILPKIDIGVNSFFPFRSKGKVSDLKWYDNIQVKYNVSLSNEVNTYDSLLFSKNIFKEMRNGVEHRIPVSLTLKVLKYFSFTNAMDYRELWYSSSITKRWVNDTLLVGDRLVPGYIDLDTITGFKTAREFGFTSSISTSVYGMLQFRNGPIRAIRHVFRPSVSFSLRPDFGDPRYGYYRDVQSDTLGNINSYSIFEGSIYGSPSTGKSGSLNFGFNNTLEMKVRSKKDTITGTQKVMLLESFSFGTSYNLANDSLQWSPLNLQARTTLFKKVQISYNATFDPYVSDFSGRRINQFEWDVNRKLFRRENSNWNLSFSYNFSSDDKKKSNSQPVVPTGNVPTEENQDNIINPDNYVNWNNSWNFSFSYNLRYNDRRLYPSRQMDDALVQTLGFNGDVNITPKWKVNFSSGYDFQGKKLSYTSLNVYRDLHCWEMRFNWIPIGYLKSWNFYIKVKASVLQDLKLNRKKDFRDN